MLSEFHPTGDLRLKMKEYDKFYVQKIIENLNRWSQSYCDLYCGGAWNGEFSQELTTKKILLSIIPLWLNLEYYLPVCQNRSLANFIVFYVSLTVHLDIILVNNQLDALFLMYLLFHLSTRSDHWCSEHVERWNNKYTKKSASSWFFFLYGSTTPL